MRFGLASARRQKAPLVRYLLFSVLFVASYLWCVSWLFLGARQAAPQHPRSVAPDTARGTAIAPPLGTTIQTDALRKEGSLRTELELPPLIIATTTPVPSMPATVPTTASPLVVAPPKPHEHANSHTQHTPAPRKRRVTLVPTAGATGHRYGVNLPNAEHEAAVHENPGGTEEEALAFRRALSKHQWPAVRDVRKVQWRTLATAGDSHPREGGVANAYLAALAGTWLTLDAGTSTSSAGALPRRHDGGGNHPGDYDDGNYVTRLPFDVASHAPYNCGPFEFSCRIGAYASGALPFGHSTNPLCNDVYGHGLLERFRRAKEILCAGPSSTTSDGGDVRAGAAAASPLKSSAVTCSMVTVHSTHDVATSVCRAERFRVRFDYILNGDYPWLSFQGGALDLHCQDTPRGAAVHHQRGTFIHCLADWLELGYSSSPSNSPPAANWHEGYECDSVVSTPTLFVTRSGDYSPFALSHDWLNTVILAAAENIPIEDLQIVVMDRMHVGFYTPVWQIALSPKHEILWWHDLKDAAMQSKYHATCYERAWFNIPARLSPIYDEDECGGDGPHTFASPLYHVYRDHLLNQLGALRTVGGVAHDDEEHERNFAGQGMTAVVVTLIMRKNYATGHAIGRRIANADALTAALRQTLNGDAAAGTSTSASSTSTLRRVVVNQVDFAAHDFPLQLNISRATDVLVAMHGAGLAQMMFMHPWGGVFEFFCPEKPSSNYRYRQLANKMGLRYKSYSIQSESNEVPVAEALPLLVELVRSVQKDKAQMLGLTP